MPSVFARLGGSRAPCVWSGLAVLLVVFPLLAERAPAQVSLDKDDLWIEGDLGVFRADLKVSRALPWSLGYRTRLGGLPRPGSASTDGVLRARLTLKADRPATPPEVTLRAAFPSLDVAAFWNPSISNDKVNYDRNRFDARATRRAPVTTLMSADGTNRMTIAASDTVNKVDLATWLREENGFFQVGVTFLSERLPATTSYEVEVVFDPRPVGWEDALECVTNWWASMPGQRPASVPEGAFAPVYSTGYAFHQQLDTAILLEELALAADLGYGAVIVADGWQTLDDQRGYRYTGDWRPERMGDMRAFVDAVHALGMRVLLWYSVPLVGEQSQARARFEGMTLRHWEEQGAFVLDPRYPEVRAFLIDTYVTALREWNLDGFKFDFLGFFAAGDDTPLTAEDGRDIASVDEAADRLMADLMADLSAVRHDVLVEFRQPYIGPRMRVYGNMFRAVDCPNNAHANRCETTDVRLLAGDTAVHSDMLMWRPEEPIEAAAQQLLNVLFSVPQISVRLTELPPEHLAMVRFWTRFWLDYREVLVRGEFEAGSPAHNYPILRSGSPDGRVEVAAVYSDHVVSMESSRVVEFVIVNARREAGVVVESPFDRGLVSIRVQDVVGELVSEREVLFPAGAHRLDVPPSGVVTIRGVR